MNKLEKQTDFVQKDEKVKSKNDQDLDNLKRKAVWFDEDDEINIEQGFDGARKLPKKVEPEQRYKDYLESKFTSLYKTPKWAKKEEKKKKTDSDESDSDDSDDELMRTAGNFIAKTNQIEKDYLDIKNCSKLTKNFNLKSTAKSVQFHPTKKMALIASYWGNIYLCEVDGKDNKHIQTVKFHRFPIDNARFINNGQQIVVGSSSKDGYFFYYDLPSGKMIKVPFVKGKEKFHLEKFVVSNDGTYIASQGENGFVHILSAKTKENVLDLKMNSVSSMSFNADSSLLFVHGKEGKVYVWDMRNSRNCLNRFVDEGCVEGTAISLSFDDQYCVTGSDVGVVNFYNYSDVLIQSEPKPIKSLLNLTTEITTLKFNHTSKLLFMSSSVKDNSIKCVHMSSLSVYQNFPFANKNYKRIYDIDISPNSGYLTFANNFGTSFLFRLNYFSKY